MHFWKKKQRANHCAGRIEYEWNRKAAVAGDWEVGQPKMLQKQESASVVQSKQEGLDDR